MWCVLTPTLLNTCADWLLSRVVDLGTHGAPIVEVEVTFFLGLTDARPLQVTSRHQVLLAWNTKQTKIGPTHLTLKSEGCWVSFVQQPWL